jgi:hypothetical protein
MLLQRYTLRINGLSFLHVARCSSHRYMSPKLYLFFLRVPLCLAYFQKEPKENLVFRLTFRLPQSSVYRMNRHVPKLFLVDLFLLTTAHCPKCIATHHVLGLME